MPVLVRSYHDSMGTKARSLQVLSHGYSNILAKSAKIRQDIHGVSTREIMSAKNER